MPRFREELGDDEAGTQIHIGSCVGQTPQGTTGTLVKAKGFKGRNKPAWEWQQIQAHGAGRMDDRRRLSDRGCGKRPIGQHFALGEEVGSG